MKRKTLDSGLFYSMNRINQPQSSGLKSRVLPERMSRFTVPLLLPAFVTCLKYSCLHLLSLKTLMNFEVYASIWVSSANDKGTQLPEFDMGNFFTSQNKWLDSIGEAFEQLVGEIGSRGH